MTPGLPTEPIHKKAPNITLVNIDKNSEKIAVLIQNLEDLKNTAKRDAATFLAVFTTLKTAAELTRENLELALNYTQKKQKYAILPPDDLEGQVTLMEKIIGQAQKAMTILQKPDESATKKELLRRCNTETGLWFLSMESIIAAQNEFLKPLRQQMHEIPPRKKKDTPNEKPEPVSTSPSGQEFVTGNWKKEEKETNPRFLKPEDNNLRMLLKELAPIGASEIKKLTAELESTTPKPAQIIKILLEIEEKLLTLPTENTLSAAEILSIILSDPLKYLGSEPQFRNMTWRQYYEALSPAPEKSRLKDHLKTLLAGSSHVVLTPLVKGKKWDDILFFMDWTGKTADGFLYAFKTVFTQTIKTHLVPYKSGETTMEWLRRCSDEFTGVWNVQKVSSGKKSEEESLADMLVKLTDYLTMTPELTAAIFHSLPLPASDTVIDLVMAKWFRDSKTAVAAFNHSPFKETLLVLGEMEASSVNESRLILVSGHKFLKILSYIFRQTICFDLQSKIKEILSTELEGIGSEGSIIKSLEKEEDATASGTKTQTGAEDTLSLADGATRYFKYLAQTILEATGKTLETTANSPEKMIYTVLSSLAKQSGISPTNLMKRFLIFRMMIPVITEYKQFFSDKEIPEGVADGIILIAKILQYGVTNYTGISKNQSHLKGFETFLPEIDGTISGMAEKLRALMPPVYVSKTPHTLTPDPGISLKGKAWQCFHTDEKAYRNILKEIDKITKDIRAKKFKEALDSLNNLAEKKLHQYLGKKENISGAIKEFNAFLLSPERLLQWIMTSIQLDEKGESLCDLFLLLKAYKNIMTGTRIPCEDLMRLILMEPMEKGLTLLACYGNKKGDMPEQAVHLAKNSSKIEDVYRKHLVADLFKLLSTKVNAEDRIPRWTELSKMITGSQMAVALPCISLDPSTLTLEILAEPGASHHRLFVEFLTARKSMESFGFYCQVMAYKKEADLSKRRSMLQNIYKAYIQNIPSAEEGLGFGNETDYVNIASATLARFKADQLQTTFETADPDLFEKTIASSGDIGVLLDAELRLFKEMLTEVRAVFPHLDVKIHRTTGEKQLKIKDLNGSSVSENKS